MSTINSFKLNGNIYVAVDTSVDNVCKGCAFEKVDDCLEYVSSYCTNRGRSDGREVIWIKQEEQGGEAASSSSSTS